MTSSPLARFAHLMRDPDPNGAKHFAADMMRETGMIVLNPEWVNGWGDRELVRKIAERTLQNYGRRK